LRDLKFEEKRKLNFAKALAQLDAAYEKERRCADVFEQRMQDFA
jgi:hypothetical protein